MDFIHLNQTSLAESALLLKLYVMAQTLYMFTMALGYLLNQSNPYSR